MWSVRPPTAPLAYTIKASLRGDTQATPTVVNSTPVPLLVLGAGAATCPNLDLSGKTTGAIAVRGNALIDGVCSSPAITGDQALLQTTGTTSTISGIVDPFRNRPAPSSTACADGGVNPVIIGPSPDADAVVVYPQAVDLTTNTVFQPGRFVFCKGLKFTSGEITGSDVLLYVPSGTFDVAPAATVDLTGRTTGDANMLVWVATDNQTIAIAGGNRVNNFRGLIYAPTSRLQLSSVMAANTGGVNVQRLAVAGVGEARIGLPLPVLAIGPPMLPTAKVGVLYSATLSATGGEGPYRWCPGTVTNCAVPYSANGLPSEFSIVAATGVLSGTPTSSASPPIVVTVFDATSQAASLDYSIAVDIGLGVFAGHQDVGSTGRPGEASYSDPTYTVAVGKGGIGGTSDGFQFVYQSMSGDGRLTARVVSLVSNDSGAQAGVMFRDNLAAGSSLAMMDITESSGGEFLYRAGTGSPMTVVANGSPSAPYWVRLTRVGNFITGERSADGVTWVGSEQRTVVMASTIYVGLAVATRNNSVNLVTATFDNVAITYPPPAAPVVIATAAPLVYAENDTTVVDPGLTVTDADSANLVFASVEMTTGFVSGQDTLGFVNQNGITGTWTPATGVLALSGSATVADYQLALRSITYRNASDTPNLATRTVTFVANDGIQSADSASRTITLNTVNDAPVVAPTAASLAYLENGTAVVDSGLTVTDVDNVSLVSASVALTTNRVAAQDTLGFVNQNGITGVWTAATSVLALSGSATVADYQLALRSITYNNNSDAPSTLARTVTFVVNDGVVNSNIASRTITVTAVNDAPVNGVPGAQVTARNVSRVFSVANANLISISDVDAAAATVQVQLTATNGTITLSSPAGLTFTVGDGTSDTTMTFTGTIATVNTRLAGLSFIPVTNYAGAASLQIVTNDLGATGGGNLTDNDTIAVKVNSAPVVAPTAASLAYLENGTAVVDSGLTVTDVDNVSLVSASVALTTNRVAAQDTLGFVNQNGITGVWTAATSVLALSGSATVADYQLALRSITYNNNSDAPSTLARTVTFVVNDGVVNSNIASRTITVTAVNDAPVNGVPGAQVTARNVSRVFSVANANLISISDVDAGTSLVQIQLVATNGTSTLSRITGLTFSAGNGTANATMTFTGTIANVNAALAGMRFNPTSGYVGAASLQIVTNDLGATGGGNLTDNDTIAVKVNSAPVVAPTAASLAYLENGTAVVDSGLTVTDVDNVSLVSASVALTTNRVAAQDTLGFVNQNGITGVWTAATSVLALSGSATVADYQLALRSITYNNNSDAPSTLARTVTFVVNDGVVNSNMASRTITVTAVNDAPVNGVPGAQVTARNVSRVFSVANANLISISDVDAAAATVQVQLTATNGTITLSSPAGLTFTVGDGTSDATMTFTGTIATVNTRLAGLSFNPTSGYAGAASLQIVTNDRGFSGLGGTLTDSDTIAISVT